MEKNPLETIQKSDKKLFETIMKTRETAFEEGQLSARHKLLIALAIDAAEGAVNGIRSLAIQAREAGATKEEIMETLRIVNHICGAGKMYTAARALEGLDL